MKLKAFANGLLLQAEMLGDGELYIAFKNQDGKWVKVNASALVRNGNDGSYTLYPHAGDSPSKVLVQP